MKQLILACALLAGCTDMFTTAVRSTDAPTTIGDTPIVNPTSAVANQFDIGAICASVAKARGTAAAQSGIADLRQRAQFTEPELAYIANGQVATGMSEKAGLCALGGNGISIRKVKTTTSTGHVTKVFTFGNGSVLNTDNGVVTSLGQ